MENEMKRIEEEKARKDAEENAKRLKEEEEVKRLEEEIAKKNLHKKSPTFGQFCEDPKVQVPPDESKRTFNEHDILGEFDRDEKGNIVIL